MNFRVTCELEYTLYDPATFLFAFKCIETNGQKILHENLRVDPFVAVEDFSIPGGMNCFSRIQTWNPGTLGIRYEADVMTQTEIHQVASLIPETPGSLSPEALPFLFPSRYAQSDRFRQEAMDLFGNLSGPHEIAIAVSDWIYQNVSYISGSSGETSSAVDTLQQRSGVCRDFAHLGIAFCRALNVPARYAACYAYQLDPPDFHACFEAYIHGRWFVFDSTRLAPLNGLVRIATGRDAADAAVCTIFGNPELNRSVVSAVCLDPDFVPVTQKDLSERGEVLALL